jgi:hypothetical protein
MLERIVLGGIDRPTAKKQLAKAIADRAVAVRAVIDRSERNGGGAVFSGEHLEVPKWLTTDDFDWPNSRPVVDWNTGPGEVARRYFINADWRRRRIKVLEVYLPDADGIWFSTTARAGQQGEPQAKTRAAPAESEAKAPSSVKVRIPGPRARIRDELVKLHRNGTDIQQAPRGELHRKALSLAGIDQLGASRSTFDRALAAACKIIEQD